METSILGVRAGGEEGGATKAVGTQHDNDNCFFIHSATLTCFDLLNGILFPFCFVFFSLSLSWDNGTDTTK